jgi:hypothetical protein
LLQAAARVHSRQFNISASDASAQKMVLAAASKSNDDDLLVACQAFFENGGRLES